MERNLVNTSYISSSDFHPLRLLPGETSGHHRKPRKKRTNKHVRNSCEPAPNPKPARKPDPSAPKITRPCTECGRKFWSWKALFGHMRCHPEREWRGIVPPPNVRRNPAEMYDDDGGASSVVTGEDHEVAACLLMLASGPPLRAAASDTCTVNQGAAADAEAEFSDVGPVEMAVDPSNCGRFECASCKKVFGSHQALGGHRASHKNVKGCYAITKSVDGEEFEGCCSVDFNHALMMVKENNHSSNGHKCNICFRVFSSGQALGGHMRCHWEKAGEQSSSRVFAFDLNLAAPLHDEDEDYTSFACSSGVALDLRLGL